MGQGTTLFFLGILAHQQQTALPAAAWTALMPFIVAAAWRWRVLRAPAWLACGFLWTLLHAHLVLGERLDPALEGEDLVVEGIVAAIPETRQRGVRFELRTERLTHAGGAAPPPGLVRLNWYDAPAAVRAGERWRLKVRLRRPHGFANPGGFDYESWLFRKRIRATGYVRAGPDNHRIAAAPATGLHAARERIGDHIAARLDRSEFRGIVTALAIGDRQAIDPAQWEVFRRTGTSHLVAISGLHVGLVAGLAFFTVRRLWPWLGTAALRLPAPQTAGLAAAAAALCYAALAGFSIPTQRALLMVLVVMAALWLRRRRSLLDTLMTALLFVLVFDPLAVMDGGFWLSFCAVATILFGMSGRVAAGGAWWRWGRLHVLVTIGLAPVLIVLFGQLPLASPLANFIAVPWVGFAVVPPALAGALLAPFAPAPAGLLLALADTALSLLWPVLAWIAGIGALQWSQHAPPAWAVAAAVVAVALLLAPRGMPARWLAVPWLLPALLIMPPTPAAGGFELMLLDVGQGLSAVIRTRGHVLVYDTGARFSAGFDAGGAVVLPYLRHAGIKVIDTLIISHDDNDHIGGAAALAGAIPVRRAISGTPEALPWWPARHCIAGDTWIRDGVRFEILHPGPGSTWRGNDASCVLRVDNGSVALLLPGDIEAGVEATLLRAGGERLKADILVAPHHGSRSSSTRAFVDAVAPSAVLIAAGHRNRWNHPHPEVVSRYRTAGATIHTSAMHGALQYRIAAGGEAGAPQAWRPQRARYWHERPSS